MKDIISKSKGHPRKRLSHVYDLCKSRKVCEGGDEMEKANMDEPPPGEDGDGQKKVTCCFVYSERI